MKTFQELLRELEACKDARIWARGKTIEQVVEECHRGDWLLWLAHEVDIELQPFTLAKGHCANTVRHLMKDERSIKAVDTAISFGEGRATSKELDAAADAAAAARAAAYAADAAADYAADYAAAAAADYTDYAADYAAAADAAAAALAAADAADYAADYAAAAADAAAADAAAADAAAYARKENRKQTADICREHIGQLIIVKVNELLKN